jgi:hypothetical protein
VFRNPDKLALIPYREYMRDNLPTPGQGMVVEDMDVIALQIGALCGRHRDADGKFMMIEIKSFGARMGYAQTRLFSMMHRLMRAGDPQKEYYVGFYLLHWDDNNNKPVSINHQPCTEQEFKDWMVGETTLLSLFDSRSQEYRGDRT